MNLQQALQQGIARLSGDSARLDAEVLLSHVLQKRRVFLYTWPETPLNDAQLQAFEKLLIRRAAGEPVAYLVGEREFWSLSLQVNSHTLIPRPDTEVLVEQALRHLPEGAQVLDLGTGTGAIALALASERPDISVLATDRSADALAVAQANAKRLQLPIRCEQSDWFDMIDPLCRFDLILSNPPYIADTDPHLEEGDVRFEPRFALVSGSDGLQDIRRITKTAPDFLYPGGWLMLEHGFEQGEDVRDILVARGFVEVSTVRDFGGNERVTLGRWEETL